MSSLECNLASLLVPLGCFAGLCWIFRSSLVHFALGAAIVTTPLSHATFVPQQLFGLPGVNPVNVIWLVAALCVFWGATESELRRAVANFFSWPLLVFGLLYLVAVIRTASDVDALFPFYAVDRPSAKEVLVFSGIKPLHYLATGFLACVYGIRQGQLQACEKALLVLPLVLASITAIYFAWGGAPLPGEPPYRSGRRSISDNLGLHANYMGRMALYLLLFAVTYRGRSWSRLRPFSGFAAILAIALSFSRTVYIASALLLPVALRRRPWRDRLWVVGSALVVATLLYPQLSARVRYGFDTTRSDSVEGAVGRPEVELEENRIDRVLAGRTGRIWPLVWPSVAEHPWFGQGLLSVWKPVDREHRLNYDHPHNGYLEVLLDMGLVGLAALGCLLGWIWRVGANYDFLRFLMAGWALMALSGDTFYPHLQNSVNWIVLGMAVAASSDARERSTAI